MGLFRKKEGVKKEVKLKKDASSLPTLPKLPRLPDFAESEEGTQTYKLPSFPSNSLGKKFSDDTIKDAVAGEKEDESFADDFIDEDEKRMMQEPSRKPLIEEIEEGMPLKSKRVGMVKEKSITEPIFIRIDRFEEALRVFNETKKKMFEIERILEDIRKVKEREEGELKNWENEIKIMKEQIEKVDKDIFSKI